MLARTVSPTAADGVRMTSAVLPVGVSGRVHEHTLALRNDGPEAVTVHRLDALHVALESREWTALHFTSDWGTEFEPVETATAVPLSIVTRSGRSSRGAHPLLVLRSPQATVLVAPAWSGNWHIDVDENAVVTAGVAPLDFFLELGAGESVTAPSVFVAVGSDLRDAGAALADAVGREVLPRTPWSDALPTEWNHWWPYEDAEIDEATFLGEARRASALGFEVATLDAGWFGRPEAGSDWQQERGDWAQVNTARFPHGLPALGDETRDRGVEFGIWVEAEAVGARSRLRADRPELLALRRSADGADRMTVSLDPGDREFLGYVCLGSPEARRFVAQTLDVTVESTGARWLKLDFNVDPGSGCDRTDHGHGAGDGLFRHYLGLYEVLDEFRRRHPEVVLEACSSGGLRIDLGLARHVHCFFLSDPDYTEHALQVLWAAALMLPPAAILHWTESQWRGDHPRQAKRFDHVPVAAFDRSVRAAMLHRYGASLRLSELRDDLADRLATHLRFFREHLVPVLRDGVLTQSSAQPLRDGRGERMPVLQVDSPAGHLVAAFDLDGSGDRVVARWVGLDEAARYRVVEPDGDAGDSTGAELMHGLERSGLSALLLATPIDGSTR